MSKKVAKNKVTAKPVKKVATKPNTVKATAVCCPKTRVASKPKNTKTWSYTYSEFIENIKSFCGLQKRTEAKAMLDDIALFVKDSLKKGYKLPLFGLGKMYVRKTAPRVGRNPATGAEIQIPAKKRIKFAAAKALKEHVL